MTPGRVLFVGLLLTAGLLYVLNPGPEAFREFLTTEAAKRASGDAENGVTDFLADRLGRRAGSLASDQFEREDYYVASVYTADLNGRIPGGEWTYLGIAGWFTPLEQPGDGR
ncbi:hypothetical protein [Rubrivirga sp.]|uniref:hypothetical protein n=1 Tax=Rubrivirga sp. TaxID=1885344 RepID=UPI003B52D11C